MALAQKSTPTIPTAQDRIDYLVNMSDADLCGVFNGSKVLIEEPISNRRSIKSPFDCSELEMRSKLDIGKYLGDIVHSEWSQTMMRDVANSIRVAAQMAPEMIRAAVNEIRRNNSLTPVIEAELTDGPFIGTVRSQNAEQTVLIDEPGSKLIIFDNDKLMNLPKVGSKVKLSRPEGALAFTVTTLQQAAEQTRSASRGMAM